MTDEKSDAERGVTLNNGAALELIKELDRKIDAMQGQLNDLVKEFNKLDGAHNGELKNLEASGRERYEAHRDRIVMLERRVTEVNPELITREFEHLSEKLARVRKDVENARQTDVQQDDRWTGVLSAIIKGGWGALLIAASAAITWALTKTK